MWIIWVDNIHRISWSFYKVILSDNRNYIIFLKTMLVNILYKQGI
nr:MAG TPA: hypothetical protein [Caudoviricetes sp.]